MKKFFITLTMVLLGLFAGVNNVWGQIDMSGIDPDDPAKWFYVRLNASVSNPGCGTNDPGKVYLIYTNSDDARTPQNPWILGPKPANPYAEYGTDDWRYRQWSEEYGFTEGMNDAKNGLEKSYRDYWEEWTDNYAVKAGYDAGYDWYKSGHYLNASNPTGAPDNSSAWSSSASLNGYSFLYAPGFDDIMGYSAYAYFFGKAAENDGWYFTGWSFTEGESDLGGVVGTADSLQFRILPSATNGEENIRNEYVYATFRPVMVSDYKVNGLINASVSNTTTVTFEVVGQRVSTADFTASVPEANFSAEITSCVGNKVTVTVTYTGTTDGEFRGNVTLASKSGCSQLTAPVYARVGADASDEATLYDGKTPTSTSGTLSAMITAANNTDMIVVLNKNIESATNVNAKVTLNFNGYNIANTLTVSGGEMTVVYSKYGGGANALAVTGGKAILNGSEFGSLTVGASGIVEQNGAIFTAASTNAGELTTTEGRFETGLTSSGTLTINGGLFEGSIAITVSGGTANINKGTISGTEYGIQATGGTTNIISKLVSVYGATNAVKRTSGTVNLTNGKFEGETAPLAGTINLQAGYFKVDGANIGISVPAGKKVFNVLAGTEFTEGYRYFVGDDASSVGVCRIGTTSYTSLEGALAYANNTGETVTIIMTNDYTLPAGYYTLPATATLIIPMSNEQETTYPIINRVSNNSAAPTAYVQPTEFRRLTFANGVNLDVHGTIEITGTQRASDDAYATLPHGDYGLLVMNEGSHMTLQNGSVLRVWGYMIGKGETDARRGSTVHEQFQMGDWKGGGISFSMLSAASTRVFPITQYYIQNVESPVKYHPGAVLSTTTSVSANFGSMGMTAMANDIKVVGVNGLHTAMFLMDQEADAENTWVRKWYDVEHDVQTYEVNSGAHLGSMVLDLGKLGTSPLVMNSGYFVLPLTNNMKIHLLSGIMDFTQTTSLLPGAEVEVDKESVISVVENPDPDVFSGSLYIYDADDWRYAGGKGDAANTFYTKVVPYSPSVGGKPSVRAETAKPADAKINVHGSFDTGDGAIYTTPNGANIFSSNEDAGTFVFTNAAPSGTSDVYQYVMTSPSSGGYTSVAAEAAQLRNGDNTLTPTIDAESHQVFMYKNDQWQSAPNLFYFDCYAAEVDMALYAAEAQKKAKKESYDLGSAVVHLYIKPQEWVEIVGKAEIEFDWSSPANPSSDPYNPYLVGVEGNDDHTFSDADGAGRLFILMPEGCQWWEVEKKDNLYHCIHPNNDTYYYWDDDAYEWKEKRFTITWKNWDGTPIETVIDELGTTGSEYSVTYGTMAEFLGSNPTRANNIDSTYNFTGWKPALGPVTQDVTYTATYESQPRMYTIIFNNEGGVEIERQFLEHNAVPVCENTPTKVGHILQWNPAISPVIGDQTYTATWLEEPPTGWDVTFVNNAGGVLKDTYRVGVAEHPSYSGTPVKENADHLAYSSNEYTYTFWGWSAVIDGVAQRFAAGTELPCPTHATTYTAVYTEAQKTYTVTFKNGEDMLFEKTDYHYGDTPECPADKIPADESDAQYTYAYAWSPQIQTVMGNQTYQWTSTRTTNKYTVTLTSNLSGVCTFTGAGTYHYGTEITNVTVSYNDSKYTFDGWSDSETEAAHPSFTLTEDKTLTANFTIKNIQDLEIAAGASETITTPTEVKDFILTSNGTTSGQIIGASNLTIRGEAIYRIQQTFAAGTWYAVAVPWRVNPATGIYDASSRLASGSQIYIIEFDANAYASADKQNTVSYWKFLDVTGDDMMPGKLYMVYLASATNALEFHKKAGASIITNSTSVALASGSVANQSNWNAIANPALYYADLNTGADSEDVQKYNGNDSYVLGSTSGMIVGEPMFVQVASPSTVYATPAGGGSPAPFRVAQNASTDTDNRFVVELTRETRLMDRIIVQTAEEKADEYVIGKDIKKMGISSKVAQMWMERYESNLCKNTQTLENDRAEYPLSLYAPKAGEYVLDATQEQGEMVLYLTLDGVAIANLSENAYTLMLEQGYTYSYGLRISPKMPQVTTGVDELIINSKDATATKVLVNNKVYIIRGEKVYTVDGQLVK